MSWAFDDPHIPAGLRAALRAARGFEPDADPGMAAMLAAARPDPLSATVADLARRVEKIERTLVGAPPPSAARPSAEALEEIIAESRRIQVALGPLHLLIVVVFVLIMLSLFFPVIVEALKKTRNVRNQQRLQNLLNRMTLLFPKRSFSSVWDQLEKGKPVQVDGVDRASDAIRKVFTPRLAELLAQAEGRLLTAAEEEELGKLLDEAERQVNELERNLPR